MKRTVVIVALAIALLVAWFAQPSSKPRAAFKHPALASATTGNVSITASLGQCDNTYDCFDPPAGTVLNIDQLNVNCDTATLGGHAYDCERFNTGVTGRVGKDTCATISQDCIKVTGATSLSIGGEGSSISCNTAPGGGHQDGIQVLGGTDVTFTGFNDACQSSTNAQLFISGINGSLPTRIYFVHGKLNPVTPHFHNVTIGPSVSSGVIDSVVCPDQNASSPYVVNANAVTPVPQNDPSLGNTFPTSC
jgi:hypothetical protein